MGVPRTHPKLLDTAERREFVLTLRKAGANYRDIADAAVQRFGSDRLPAGWDSRYAYKDVMREMGKLRASIEESVEDIRALEISRLDALFLVAFRQAQQGILTAVDRCLRIMERRSAYLGMDAPRQVTVNWQHELEQMGISAGDAFEEMVSAIIAESQGEGGDVSGGGA